MPGDQLHPRVQDGLDRIAAAVFGTSDLQLEIPRAAVDPFGIVTDKTDSLNPMDAFDIPGVDPSALAMDVAKQLSGGGMSLKDPFWDIRGHDLAAGVISGAA